MSRYRYSKTVRLAIEDAADFIEANPLLHEYTCSSMHRNSGTPGCALVWIDYFLHPMKPFLRAKAVAEDLGLDWQHPIFYEMEKPLDLESYRFGRASVPTRLVARNMRIFARSRVKS